MIDSKKIRQIRESRGMSTRGLAREAGVSTETVHALEHGTHGVTVSTLNKIAAALGVEAKDLF